MEIAGIIVMSIGVGGVLASTIAEIKMREPIYALLMKVFPIVFGIGCFLFSLGS